MGDATMQGIRWLRPFALLCGALLAAPAARALDADESLGFERTPPRLGFVDGEVSFSRPGAGDWAPAQVNTALAAGDELFTGDDANLELQVGASAFVRAGEHTQLALTSLEPDFLQLRVTEGTLSLDLRSRKTSQTIEIDTPNAAFTVEHTGYYRVEVDGETTTFTSRRGGRAEVTTASGSSAAIAPSEQLVVTGADAAGVETYAAAELDAWDRWNYERTDEQLDAVSARYVPSGVYGVDNLDHYGDWRLVSSYGAVWVPRAVPVGWVPYSTGRWMYDPYYGWTWVDDAPWGWAPYHYGRWVHVSGYWGWCPGRVIARPYYSPALVAFYGGKHWSVGVSIGGPVGWVALGWGEPLLPWWGPVGFRGSPRWAGWGGPRVVNNVVIKQKTVIHVNDIDHYQNARVRNAIVATDRAHFGRRSGGERGFTRGDPERFSPVRGNFAAEPDRSSLVARTGAARRPSREVRERQVVAVREPRLDRTPELGTRRGAGSGRPQARGREAEPVDASPPTRLVQPTRDREGRRIETSRRPPFGRSGESERRISAPAPRFEEVRRELEAGSSRERAREEREQRGAREAQEPRGAREAPEAPAREAQEQRVREASERRGGPSRSTREPARERRGRAESTPVSAEQPSAAPPARQAPSPREVGGESRTRGSSASARRERAAPVVRRERASPEVRELPGEPANRVYPQRSPASPTREAQASRSGPLGGREMRESPRTGGGELRGMPSRRGGGEVRGGQPRSGGGEAGSEGSRPGGGRGGGGSRGGRDR